jgi:hypothetical protein
MAQHDGRGPNPLSRPTRHEAAELLTCVSPADAPTPNLTRCAQGPTRHHRTQARTDRYRDRDPRRTRLGTMTTAHAAAHRDTADCLSTHTIPTYPCAHALSSAPRTTHNSTRPRKSNGRPPRPAQIGSSTAENCGRLRRIRSLLAQKPGIHPHGRRAGIQSARAAGANPRMGSARLRRASRRGEACHGATPHHRRPQRGGHSHKPIKPVSHASRATTAGNQQAAHRQQTGASRGRDVAVERP